MFLIVLAVIFAALAILMGLFGFRGAAFISAEFARLLLIVFLVIFLAVIILNVA